MVRLTTAQWRQLAGFRAAGAEGTRVFSFAENRFIHVSDTVTRALGMSSAEFCSLSLEGYEEIAPGFKYRIEKLRQLDVMIANPTLTTSKGKIIQWVTYWRAVEIDDQRYLVSLDRIVNEYFDKQAIIGYMVEQYGAHLRSLTIDDVVSRVNGLTIFAELDPVEQMKYARHMQLDTEAWRRIARLRGGPNDRTLVYCYRNGRIIHASKGAEKQFGLTRKEIFSVEFATIDPDVQSNIEYLRNHDSLVQFRWEKLGRVYLMMLEAVMIGKNRYIVSLGRDITDDDNESAI